MCIELPLSAGAGGGAACRAEEVPVLAFLFTDRDGGGEIRESLESERTSGGPVSAVQTQT